MPDVAEDDDPGLEAAIAGTDLRSLFDTAAINEQVLDRQAAKRMPSLLGGLSRLSRDGDPDGMHARVCEYLEGAIRCLLKQLFPKRSQRKRYFDAQRAYTEARQAELVAEGVVMPLPEGKYVDLLTLGLLQESARLTVQLRSLDGGIRRDRVRGTVDEAGRQVLDEVWRVVDEQLDEEQRQRLVKRLADRDDEEEANRRAIADRIHRKLTSSDDFEDLLG
jgi:hypothetical protein